jgi:hypothetical protein
LWTVLGHRPKTIDVKGKTISSSQHRLV